ncbi:hypothetical protein N9L79_07400 [Alphaproteobacteria bacterium]|nr:hypothetical protein [Alphaproteobacteria bacterium]
METYDEQAKRVNEAYAETNDIDLTVKKTGISRLVVLEAVGFSDEWAFIFDDD